MKMKPCSVVYSCQFQPGEKREMKAEKGFRLFHYQMELDFKDSSWPPIEEGGARVAQCLSSNSGDPDLAFPSIN
jgi:hypothetical protein